MDIRDNEIQLNLSEKDYEKLAFHLLATATWFQMQYNRSLKPFGMTLAPYNILILLNEQRGRVVTMKYIKDRMYDRNANVTRFVNELAENGLIDKAVSTRDLRQVNLEITQKGVDFLESIAFLAKKNTEILTVFSDKEIFQMKTFLNRIRCSSIK